LNGGLIITIQKWWLCVGFSSLT